MFIYGITKKRVVVVTPTGIEEGVIVPMEAHQDLQKISNKTISLTEGYLKSSQFFRYSQWNFQTKKLDLNTDRYMKKL